MNETQLKILDAAEVEFAKNGFVGASIRNITQRAGVNVASINYHFGSKEELFKQLFQYRLKPLNDKRLDLLREEQARYADQAVPLPVLVNALVRPALEQMLSPEGCRFVRAIARCMSEPLAFMECLDEEIFHEIFTAYCEAIGRAMPHLNLEEVENQMNFVICSLIGMMMHFPKFGVIKGKLMSPLEFERLLDQFIHFISSGMEGALGS